MKTHQFLNIGQGGKFNALSDPGCLQGPDAIDAFFSKLAADKKTKLVIHFHGGLVSREEGLKISERMHALYTDKDTEVLSMVWETSLAETLRDKLLSINQTKFFSLLLRLLLKTLLEKTGIYPGVKGINRIDKQTLEQELKKEKPFEQWDHQISLTEREHRQISRDLKETFETALSRSYNEINACAREEKFLSKPQLFDQENEGGKGIVSMTRLVQALVVVSKKTIERLLQERDHGLYPTLVEEILREFYIADLGAWFWSSMKQKAKEMWNTNEGIDKDEYHAGTCLLESLLKHRKRHELSVDVTGHSAGAIAICEMLKTVSEPANTPTSIRKIIFLAPACRCDLFAETLIAHPELYEHFLMMTMNDELECKDSLLKGIYTRSLLYFVSGCLENDGEGYDEYLLGMHRYQQDTQPYKDIPLLQSIRQFLNSSKARVIYSPSDRQQPEGWRCLAAKHGDFDNATDESGRDLLTLESLAFQIKN